MILVAAADDPVDEKEPEKFAKVKPKGELFFLIWILKQCSFTFRYIYKWFVIVHFTLKVFRNFTVGKQL